MMFMCICVYIVISMLLSKRVILSPILSFVVFYYKPSYRNLICLL